MKNASIILIRHPNSHVQSFSEITDQPGDGHFEPLISTFFDEGLH